VTRAELIAELTASNPHLRPMDAELIVATVFDQITATLARRARAAWVRRLNVLTRQSGGRH
jgi:integration host factor subunit beta